MNQMPADLHLHTTTSDGSLTPRELLDKALTLGLDIIAITDHDTVDGLYAIEGYEYQGLEIIPGIEFSTDYREHEVHILGYGIDIRNKDLTTQLTHLQAERVQRTKEMIERLAELGYPIDYERVKQLAGTGTVGRVHIAQALIERGYIRTISEGFTRFLNHDAPAYVSRKKLTFSAAIELIHNAGGVAVLAHPGLINDDMIVKDIIAAGIRGLEVVHPGHNNEMEEKYYQMAQAYNLVPTGGSDSHGPKGKEQDYIGIKTIPNSWVSNLKEQMTKS